VTACPPLATRASPRAPAQRQLNQWSGLWKWTSLAHSGWKIQLPLHRRSQKPPATGIAQYDGAARCQDARPRRCADRRRCAGRRSHFSRCRCAGESVFAGQHRHLRRHLRAGRHCHGKEGGTGASTACKSASVPKILQRGEWQAGGHKLAAATAGSSGGQSRTNVSSGGR